MLLLGLLSLALPLGPAPPAGAPVVLELELLPALPAALGSDDGLAGALEDDEVAPLVGAASSPRSQATKVADNNKAGASTRYFFIAISFDPMTETHHTQSRARSDGTFRGLETSDATARSRAWRLWNY